MLAHQPLPRRGSATREAKVSAKAKGFTARKVVRDTGIGNGGSIGALGKDVCDSLLLVVWLSVMLSDLNGFTLKHSFVLCILFPAFGH